MHAHQGDVTKACTCEVALESQLVVYRSRQSTTSTSPSIGLFEEALDDGLIASNPSNRAHRLGHSKSTVRCWSPEELRSFLAAVEDEPDYPLWRLAASTGMRRGEMLGLRWGDFDLVRGTVSVQGSLCGMATR